MISPSYFPDNASSEQSIALLTVDAILRLKADYESDLKLMEELPSRIKLKKKKYEASLLFAPLGFDPDVPVKKVAAPIASIVEVPADEPLMSDLMPLDKVSNPPLQLFAEDEGGSDDAGLAQGRTTWTGELKKLLNKSSVGISHQYALTQLKETSLGERVSKGEKGFYNAVGLLEKQGFLIKNGGLLYSDKLVADMKARGELLPDVSIEMRRRPGGSGSAALEVLRANPDGLDAHTLRIEMSKMPSVPQSVTKHGHYIYNVLGTLMGHGDIEKDNEGIYKLKGVK